MQRSVMFARFPFGASDHPDTTDWLVETVLKAKADPRISQVFHTCVDDTPITMSRNLAVKRAQEAGADLLLMIDSDMSPDLPLPGARPFWDSTLNFMLDHPGPCVVGAPYCGKPPIENVFIFRWMNFETNNPNLGIKLHQVDRADAERMVGFEEVGALPTGLILIDMRVFQRLKPAYFYYEWKDSTESEKASTEDVTFSRDCSLSGIPVYVNWDAWAGHWKPKCVGKPSLLKVDQIRKQFVEAIQAALPSTDRLMMANSRLEPVSSHLPN